MFLDLPKKKAWSSNSAEITAEEDCVCPSESGSSCKGLSGPFEMELEISLASLGHSAQSLEPGAPSPGFANRVQLHKGAQFSHS